MILYILSCERTESGGGIYSFELETNGAFKKLAYFPCDRPMYAAKCDKGLCILLRQPFSDSEDSGYFYIDDNLQNATAVESTKGRIACHLCVDGNDAYIVNYLSGNIVKNGITSVQRVGKSVNIFRQAEPHTHFIGQTPDGYFAVCDLGTDTLAVYDKNLRTLSETQVPAGYGIRHLTFSKDGKYIYAVNELVPSVSVFAYKDGQTTILHTIKIDCENENASGAAIRISDDAKYLYISLREENAICVFSLGGANLTLEQKVDCGGEGPRDFNIFGDCLVCCNEKSNNVSVFRIENGKVKNKISETELAHALCCL